MWRSHDSSGRGARARVHWGGAIGALLYWGTSARRGTGAAPGAPPGTAVCMMVDEPLGAPDPVVPIPIDHPVRGAAVAVDLTALTDKRLTSGELLGTVDTPTMDRISAALRVPLDLT